MKTIAGNHLALKCLNLLCVIAIGVAGLLSGGAFSVLAQEPQTITATGTFGSSGSYDCSSGQCPLTLTFPPAGGAVTGGWTGSGEVEGVAVMATLTMTGTFAGGDGGAASGTWIGTFGGENAQCTDCWVWRGSWNGKFYASGTGSGILDTETIYVPSVSPDVMESKVSDSAWEVTFSAAEFQGALGTVEGPDESQAVLPPAEAPAEAADEAVTTEYIYNRYGITVEDSFADGKWARKTWSDEELILLNEVLKELPPGFLEKAAVTSIIRSEINVWDPAHPKPNTFGYYDPCDKRTGNEECTASTAAIRIFDQALHPYDFANDPDGKKEFKATILHELTHALQAYKEGNEIHPDAAKQLLHTNYAASPLLQNYMDATRVIPDMNNPDYFSNQNGWNLVDGRWRGGFERGNLTPTDYGKSNPKEDLSEAVMMYVYDPQKLQSSSAKRYNFIRDQIFGGVEYEDGHQKQP